MSSLIFLSLTDYQNSILPETKTKQINNAVDARQGVVRILLIDDLDNPSYYSLGSGFGVGIIGQETKYFITNQIVDEQERALNWIREAADEGIDEAVEYISWNSELFF